MASGKGTVSRWGRAVKHLAVAVVLTATSAAAVQVALTSPAHAAGPWVKPTNGTLGQGFTGPGAHAGVDIIAARWTPIYAVHGGVVEQVVCNSSTGNCDVDGSPSVSGCGWYVGIYHSDDGTGTLYCHMVTRPSVNVGQTVSTGQLIGYVGSSGNSSGPHLHFQTHLGHSTTNSNTTNPVTFMSARGVNLGGGGDPPPSNVYWVTTFANATGYTSPTSSTGGGGTLNQGLNYVYCKHWGRQIGSGSAYNHWWLLTDLDTGQTGRYVSAYYLSNWGSDEALADNTVTIPTCPGGAQPLTQYWVTTFANATGYTSWTTATGAAGQLNAGYNYVYCKYWGRDFGNGSAHNHWWLKTDLDTGQTSRYVSAYYLSYYGDDEAFADNGASIPSC